MGGMVRTLKKELEFNCQMQVPPESKTMAWITGHAATLLNLDAVGSDGKVLFKRRRGADTTGQMRVRGISVASSGLVDRSNEGRRQDGIWQIRRFSDEVQRVHFDCVWRSDNCSDHPTETSVTIWPWHRPGHWQEGALRPMGAA